MLETTLLTEALGALPATQAQAELHPIVELLDATSIFSSAVIGYIGVAIMLYGTIVAMMQFIHGSIFGKLRLSIVRVRLGKHLALGLEFLVGKDIIESIVHPTWDDLGKLGAIIALRTVVTIFLSREVKDVEAELHLEREEVELQNLKDHKA